MTQPLAVEISDSEWEVMRVIWSRRECTSSDVVSILSDEMEWSASTIKTLLSRLSTKGLLTIRKEGNRYHYSATVTESEAWRVAMTQLFNNLCAKKMGHKIGLLIEDAPLSFEDIDQLEALLLKKRKSALQEVPCDCIPGQCRCDSCIGHFES